MINIIHANGLPCQYYKLGKSIGDNQLKLFIAMKLVVFLIVGFSLSAFGDALGQKVSVEVRNMPFKSVAAIIQEQTGYSFGINKSHLDKAKPITLNVKDIDLEEALTLLFKDQPFGYKIEGKIIVVVPKQAPKAKMLNDTIQRKIRGRVTDSVGNPLPNVTVQIKGTKNVNITNGQGFYKLDKVLNDDVIVYKLMSYETTEIAYSGQGEINLVLRLQTSYLDETLVIGYGNTSRRLSTGNVSQLDRETIMQQPVTNPMQSLIGRLPGVQVQEVNGLPGSSLVVQIRGRNSIAAGNEPLYIVDGVPFSSAGLAGVSSFVNVNPLNSISPSEIESISVLKDADATAIYGSRGANGVILITTVKGVPGKVKLNININSGYGSVAHAATPMNTEQYLQLRNDAFANSGMTPTAANAPDLVSWDAGVDNRLQDWYMGNTVGSVDANLSLSGGSQQTTFLVSGALHNETTVFSAADRYRRSNVHFNIGHMSLNRRLKLNFSGFFSSDNNRLSNSASSSLINIAGSIPNYPIYDADGSYNWTANQNNFHALHTAYWKSKTTNMVGNIGIEYEIIQGLSLKSNVGLNKVLNTSMRPIPVTALNPSGNQLGSNAFTGTDNQAFVFEPQISFSRMVAGGNFNLLAGVTIQDNDNTSDFVSVNNYINDILLESRGGGVVANTGSTNTVYRFLSLFSRVNYNLSDKYILNLTFRRDGSTRFGPGKQFGNFGSVGAAWLFSNESIVRNNIAWLSYGKLRGSYGTTGSDGIGDYRYLNIYASAQDYGNTKAINPAQIANPDFRWEVTRKMEFALDLGFLNDKILFNAAWYRNRSGNQLITYPLPSITGFTGYTANLPALVQNSGWEFELNTQNITGKQFTWQSAFHLTIPRNRLVSFPDIELTSYASTLVVGQPLNIIQKYRFVDIDPATGIVRVEDINGDGTPTPRSSYNNQGGDYIIAGTTDPRWYAGLSNSFGYKGLQLSIFLQYTNQMGRNIYDANYFFGQFGRMRNFWTTHLDYWKNPGDETTLPKPMVTGSTTGWYGASNATFTDASFFRMKNVSFSYELPANLTSRAGLDKLRIYAQGQNVLTTTNYLGYDPDYASSTASVQVPPLKVWTLGVQVTF